MNSAERDPIQKILGVLDRPVVWEASRVGLDLMFGLYRVRRRQMAAWGVLDDAPSVLDIGCGVGQYSTVTTGEYLGVDMNARYIEHATRRRKSATRNFRCADVETLLAERQQFDIVLMVDFLHHIPSPICAGLLAVAKQLARRWVVSFEPVKAQRNVVGQWIIDHDRGEHMRSLDELHQLFESSPLKIVQSVPLQLGPILTRAILAQ